MKFLGTSYITYININIGRKLISSAGTNTDMPCFHKVHNSVFTFGAQQKLTYNLQF